MILKSMVSFIRKIAACYIGACLFFSEIAFASIEGAHSWISSLGISHQYHHLAASVMIFLLILLLGIYVQFNKKRILSTEVADERVSLLNLLEVFTEFILELIEAIVPKNAHRYFPLIGALVLYIFISNISSFIPGFVSPSTSISNNLAMGVCTFIFYNYCGFREHGMSYLKQFTGPMIFLAPFMFLLELISHSLRPISLSLRLFGNINGDHTVLSIFSGLVPLFVPIIFMGLGLLVCIIQTYIFSVLSTVYISIATSHDH